MTDEDLLKDPAIAELARRLQEISDAKARGVEFYSMRFWCSNCGSQAVHQLEKGTLAQKRKCGSCGCYTMSPGKPLCKE